MAVRYIKPNIRSDRFDESRAFYTDVVGLTGGPGLDWILFFGGDRREVQLSVMALDVAAGVHPDVSIEVDDVDAAHARAVAAGAEIVYPLTTEEWGLRRFFVRDPNGAVLNLTQHLDAGMTVAVVEPSPAWAEEYAAAAADLRSMLGDLVVRVDHVGSTAVPGLAAKDVIDVQVTVADDGAVRQACRLLVEHGHPVDPDGHDHPVGAVSGDPSDWAKGFARERPGQRRVHVHVRVAGRPNQVYALLFRDFLRAHPDTAAAYAEFKRRAARVLPADPATYSDLKDPVCDLVYLPARAWAAATGWSPADH